MRQIFTYLILFTFLSFSSCSYQLDKTKAPNNLIPKDSFALLLYDVMFLEAYYKANDLDFYSFQLNLQKNMQPIFEKHHVDSLRFAQSMDYYSRKQDLLIEIYNEIQDSITLQTAPFERD